MKVVPDIEMTIGQLFEMNDGPLLTVNREYQRAPAWELHQKQLFIDSLFRDYMAPAFYFHIKEIKGIGGRINEITEIIDGQQRIDAITSYMRNELELLNPNDEGAFKFPNFLKDEDCPWGGRRFRELTSELKKDLQNKNVVIYKITTDNPNEVRDLFIRLQSGTPLSPQDKRDAWPGNFTDFILLVGGKSSKDKRWPGWDLFTSRISGKESQRRQLAAQSFMLYWHKINKRDFCDIRANNIDDFYRQHINFNAEEANAKKFEEICRSINNELDDGMRLSRHHLLHLILLISDLRDHFALASWQGEIARAISTFKERCGKAKKALGDGGEKHEFHQYFANYLQWAGQGGDVARTIRIRHVFFYTEMIKIIGAVPKDPQRAFTVSDREIIFHRYGKICQACEMRKINEPSFPTHEIEWEEAEIHHVIPHSEGGKTDLANGALVHKNCHPKTKAAVEEFAERWKNKQSKTKND